MEQNKELFFTIICDENIFPSIVEKYNGVYDTDFEIIEFMYEEVLFAKIRVTQYQILDIFNLGLRYGTYVEYKKQRGEINW
jgi:hypothetical protein